MRIGGMKISFKDVVTFVIVAVVAVTTGGMGLAPALGLAGVTTGLQVYGRNQAEKLQRDLQRRMGLTAPDQGVRQQLPPGTDNKVPVIYGTVFTKGMITDARITADNQTMFYVLTLSERTQTGNFSFGQVYMNDELLNFPTYDPANPSNNLNRVTSSTLPNGVNKTDVNGQVEIYFYKDGSANPWSPNPGYSPPLAYDLIPGWDNTWTMSGLVFVVVKVTYNATKGFQGLPNLTFQVSNDLRNPGLVLYDYLTSTRYGAGIDAADIDQRSMTWTQAQLDAEDLPPSLRTWSDIEVPYRDSDGDLQQAVRYQINGILPTNRNVQENIEQITLAASTWFTFDYTRGLWRAVLNRELLEDETPRQFDDTSIIGDIRVTVTDMDAMYNRIETEYNESIYRDQTEYSRVIIDVPDRPAYEFENALQLRIETINNYVHANRLSQITLKNNRSDIFVEFSTDYSGIQVDPGDIIELTSEVHGWTNQRFRALRVSEQENEIGMITASIRAQLYRDSDYEEDEIQDISDVDRDDLPVWNFLETPAAPILVEARLRRSAPFFTVQAEVPADSGPVNEMQWWISSNGGSTFTQWATTRENLSPGAEVQQTYLNATPSSAFSVRVRTRRGDLHSDFSPVLNVTAAVPPEDPTGLFARGVAGGINLRWDPAGSQWNALWSPEQNFIPPVSWFDASYWPSVTLAADSSTTDTNMAVLQWRDRMGTRTATAVNNTYSYLTTRYPVYHTGYNEFSQSENINGGVWQYGTLQRFPDTDFSPPINSPFGNRQTADNARVGLPVTKGFKWLGTDNVGVGSVTAAQPMTLSVYAKSARVSRTQNICIGLQNNIGFFGVRFDLSRGRAEGQFIHPQIDPANQAMPTAHSIEGVGNGWYRISVTVNPTPPYNTRYAVLAIYDTKPAPLSSTSETAFISFEVPQVPLVNIEQFNGFLIWGWQLEYADRPGSYGKTRGEPHRERVPSGLPAITYASPTTSSFNGYYQVDPPIPLSRYMTVQAVFKRATPDVYAGKVVTLLGNNSSPNLTPFTWNNSDEIQASLNSSVAPVTFAGNLTQTGSYHVVSTAMDETEFLCFLNGTQVGTTQTAPADPTGQTFNQIGAIGNVSTTGTTHQSTLCEIIVWPYGMPTADRQRGEGYLAHKWGIASGLPGGHPYRLDPPTAVLGAPTSLNYHYTEIWRSNTEDRNQAVVIAQINGSTYTDFDVPAGERRYYWIRHVDMEGQYSNFSPVASNEGIDAVAGSDLSDPNLTYNSNTQTLTTGTLTSTTVQANVVTVNSSTLTIVGDPPASQISLNVAATSTFNLALTKDVNVVFISNPPASGRTLTIRLEITADGTARTITWPVSFRWPGSVAPTITATNGAKDIFEFSTSDAGTTWFARIIGQNF